LINPLIDSFSFNSSPLLTQQIMIKIRLQRHGARHAPFYRMVVAPSTARRDGKFIEVLGTYNPQAHARTEELKLKMERIDHWLGVGAQPTDTAKSLIRQGRLTPEQWLERSEKEAAKRIARAKKGKATPAMEAPEEESKVEEPATDAEPKKEEPAAEEKKEEAKAEKTEVAKEEVKVEEPAAVAEPKKEKPAAADKKEETKPAATKKAKSKPTKAKEESKKD
jgi:small subunit ribosomal protein S16